MSEKSNGKQDLTRIEDLAEFMHADDPETDRALMTEPLTLPTEEEDAVPPDVKGLDELEAAPETDSFSQIQDENAQSVADEELEPSGFDTSELDSTLEGTLESAPLETETQEGENLETEAPVTEAILESEPLLETSLESSEESSLPSDMNLTNDEQISETSTEQASEDVSFEVDTGQDQSKSFATTQTDFSAGMEENIEQPILEEQAPEMSSPLTNDSLESDISSQVAQSFNEVSKHESTSSRVRIQAMSPLEKPAPPPQAPKREDFQEVKKFGNAMNSGPIKAGGNPPYALMISSIQYREDADELLRVLEEVGLADGDHKKDIEQGLATGALLLSQLSEYSAIYLTHRIRHLDIDVRMGLAEMIHQSRSYDLEYRGLVNKESLSQNKEINVKLTEKPFTPEEILVSTTSMIEHHEIVHYLNIVRDSVVMSESELERRAKQALLKKREVNNNIVLEGGEDTLWARHIDDIYNDLTNALKIKAFQMGGNAIIGLSFGLTPLLVNHSTHYRIVAFGNVVRLTTSKPTSNQRHNFSPRT